jgi:hypothetical protein
MDTYHAKFLGAGLFGGIISTTIAVFFNYPYYIQTGQIFARFGKDLKTRKFLAPAGQPGIITMQMFTFGEVVLSFGLITGPTRQTLKALCQTSLSVYRFHGRETLPA